MALSALWLLGSAGAAARAAAQTVVGPTPVLRILSPQVGDVVEPTLDVVVVAEGRSGTTVHAELLVDGAAVRQAIHVPGDQGVRVVLSTGTERTLLVRDLPEGRHTIRLV